MQFRLVAVLLLALAVFGCEALPAQTPVWSQLPGSPSGTSPRFDDISFINENTGWVARATGGIYKTTDAGETFTLVRSSTISYPGTNLLAHFRAIAFASPARGWAGNLGPGSYDSAVTDTNVLFETFDGGLTWSSRPGFTAAGMRGLCAIQVLDSETIYGVGRVRGPAYFIKSTDGGTNWTITNLTAAGVMGGMMDVYFKDKTNGFVVGMNTNTYSDNCATTYYGRIARTTNGGASWQAVATTTVPCCYFWKMSWPSPNVGYASLQQNGSMTNHIFYKTTNGGATWISNGIPFSVLGIPSFYWQGVGFVSDDEGWAGGDSQSSPINFLRTVDGGVTWQQVGYNNSVRVNRIRFLSPTLAYASGAKLHVFRPPLGIFTQPQGQWVSPGVNVAFGVGAYGTPPFAYQWKKDGANIADATNSTYNLTNVARSHSGNYSVVVTNAAGGSLASSNAALRVFTPQRLSGPSLTGGGQVSVLFSDNLGGAMNSNYIPYFQVQATTNLVNWEILNTPLTVTNGKLVFYDTNAFRQRFYRVVEH